MYRVACGVLSWTESHVTDNLEIANFPKSEKWQVDSSSIWKQTHAQDQILPIGSRKTGEFAVPSTRISTFPAAVFPWPCI